MSGVDLDKVVIDEPVSDPPIYEDPRLRGRSSMPREVAVCVGASAQDADWLREYLSRPARSA